MFSAKLHLRSWATPFAVGTFFFMSATGVLMFFDVDSGLTAVAHQWLSLLFLVGVAAHVALNIRPFKNHLRSLLGRASLGAFAALFVVSLFSWGFVTGPQLARPIERALIDAPLSALAGVTHTDPEVLVGRLAAKDIVAVTSQSIGELAETTGMDVDRLLALVFLPE